MAIIIRTTIINQKVNIGVMKLIVVMADTTLSVSNEFHDWLKSKGRKGESYEDIIKKMLKPEYLKELEGSPSSSSSSDVLDSI